MSSTQNITQEDRYANGEACHCGTPLYTALAESTAGTILRYGNGKPAPVAFWSYEGCWKATSQAYTEERETVEEFNRARGLV